MRFKIQFVTAVVACLGFVQAASASPGINYNYAEGDFKWLHTNTNEADDGTGLNTTVSWSPVENFFLEGGYQYLNVAFPGPVNVDDNTFRYGVGAYYPIYEELHLVGRVGGIHSNQHINKLPPEVDESRSESDAGVYVGTALRYELTKEVELEPSIEYTNLSGATWTYALKGLYALDDNWQATAEAGINDDSDVELAAGIRYNWGCPAGN